MHSLRPVLDYGSLSDNLMTPLPISMYNVIETKYLHPLSNHSTESGQKIESKLKYKKKNNEKSKSYTIR